MQLALDDYGIDTKWSVYQKFNVIFTLNSKLNATGRTELDKDEVGLIH